jgi:FkbM family methyltransferase
MNPKRFAGKLLSAWHTIQTKVSPSYSQAGEDQVVRYLFNLLNIACPTYLDIGTNHPYLGNNSYYFYLRGGSGVCVEPDPSFYQLIKRHRPRDIVVPAGVNVSGNDKSELYIFPSPYTGWNTFSKNEAESRQQQTGIRIQKTQIVPLIHINDLIRKYFNPHPNFLSIDVEGLDLVILQSMNFATFKPEVICVESITFSMTNEEQKIDEIADFLETKGYFLFGDTHINSIFCRKDVYKNKMK